MQIVDFKWKDGAQHVESRLSPDEAARIYIAIYDRMMADEDFENMAMQMLGARRSNHQ